ncbi:hypothetical protein KKG22_01475 [Patescibacteria group bacterium]|nr:hypothetical protein [Patescibacteria group bacterium]MBU1721765.1 hypothetical protein [Patescibacteria group bacterium]MBU1901396.1 hypothetical protein [Patescibacteria group bacterium]
MKITCVECKNNVDMSAYSEVKVDNVIECNHCGITLVVTSIVDDIAEVDVMDEGK